MMFARPLFIQNLDNRNMDTIDDSELFGSKLLKNIYTYFFIKKEISLVKKMFNRKNLTLLDVGCGTGWVTKQYETNGFSVTGLEASQARADYAREKYKLNIYNHFAEDFNSENKYDVIIIRHLVEHLEDPQGIIRKLKKNLKDDGVFLILVPNITCIGKILFDTAWEWVIPWHCNFFSPKSAHAFAREAGLQIEKMYQTSSSLYYPSSFMKKFPNSPLNPLLRNRIAGMALFAPIAILGKFFGLGDNLNIVARNRIEA